MNMSMVDILGSIDDKIENNEKIISLLEQKMLLEYDKFIMKYETEKVAMQDIFNITIGKTPPRKESHWFTTSPTDIKWLSISDMGKAQVFAFDSNEKINDSLEVATQIDNSLFDNCLCRYTPNIFPL